MSVFHDEVEIEDFEYDEETETYSYPCPCGDRFLITRVRSAGRQCTEPGLSRSGRGVRAGPRPSAGETLPTAAGSACPR